jgi:hypothetical protein
MGNYLSGKRVGQWILIYDQINNGVDLNDADDTLLA